MSDDSLKYKIILAGEGAVGKTTLINRFVTGSFTTDYKATIGVSIFSKSVEFNNNFVNLQIWDMAGQQLFRKFRKRFYANASGSLLVFDVTVPASLDLLQNWITDIKEVTDDIPFVLIGNKIDLENLQSIYQEDIDEFVANHSEDIIVNYLTSAKTGENVEQAFLDLVTQII
jgi:small GTP-binding protein